MSPLFILKGYTMKLISKTQDSSYHTDDKQDALDTANSMLGFYRIRLELIQDGVI